ncbi:uncharacterized protein LOC105354618 isoform X2 [Oryzias latipes]
MLLFPMTLQLRVNLQSHKSLWFLQNSEVLLLLLRVMKHHHLQGFKLQSPKLRDLNKNLLFPKNGKISLLLHLLHHQLWSQFKHQRDTLNYLSKTNGCQSASSGHRKRDLSHQHFLETPRIPVGLTKPSHSLRFLTDQLLLLEIDNSLLPPPVFVMTYHPQLRIKLQSHGLRFLTDQLLLLEIDNSLLPPPVFVMTYHPQLRIKLQRQSPHLYHCLLQTTTMRVAMHTSELFQITRTIRNQGGLNLIHNCNQLLS